MYEKQTEEVIKQRMLGRIPSDVDKSEGSFVYDAISPAAIELAQAYIELDGVLEKVFAVTGYGQWLEKRAEEFGVVRKLGTKAAGFITIKGQSDKEIPQATLVQTESGLQYRTLDKAVILSGSITIGIEAVDTGKKYNIDTAGMITQMPVQLMGVVSVTNESPVVGGTDPETDEMLRERLLDKVRNLATSGNKNHYRQWAMKVEGVGDVKVFPLWNNCPGSVRVVIVDNFKGVASEALIRRVKDEIEKERPVCVDVLVESASKVEVRIAAYITLKPGFDKDIIEKQFQKEIDRYIKGMAFRKNRVSLAAIIDVLMDIEGVEDCDALYLNDVKESIELKDDEVVVLKEATVYDSREERRM